MRVLVIGASGTIGSAVVAAFEELGDEVIPVSRSTSPAADLTDVESLRALFEQVGTVDAVITAAGHVPFATITEATPENVAAGFASKLAGQINTVLAGLPHIAENGSFTITTGILGQLPIPGSLLVAAVNGGLEGFVKRAPIDLPGGVRINAVNPTIVLEPGQVSEPFRGVHSLTAAEVAQSYVRSAYGIETGQVFRAW